MSTEKRKAQRKAEVEGGRVRRAKRLELNKVYNAALRAELARLRREAEDFKHHQAVIAGSKKLAAEAGRAARKALAEEKRLLAAAAEDSRQHQAVMAGNKKLLEAEAVRLRRLEREERATQRVELEAKAARRAIEAGQFRKPEEREI